MMTSFYRAVITLSLIATLSACSLFSKNEPEYLDSVESEALKIPEGLDDPTGPAPTNISVERMRLPTQDEQEPMPPRVVNTTGKKNADLHMDWSNEGAFLLVKGPSKEVSERLLAAIEKSGMELLQASESGAHKFQYTQVMPAKEGFFAKMAFWRSDQVDYSGTFMTSLRADGKHMRVYLLVGYGEACDTANSEHVLGILMDQFG